MSVLFSITSDMPSNKPNISDASHRLERSPDGALLIQVTRTGSGNSAKCFVGATCGRPQRSDTQQWVVTEPRATTGRPYGNVNHLRNCVRE